MALEHDTTVQDKEKAAPAWLWLTRVAVSPQAKVLPLATLSLALCSLHASSQRRDDISLPGRAITAFQPHGFLPAINCVTFRTG